MADKDAAMEAADTTMTYLKDLIHSKAVLVQALKIAEKFEAMKTSGRQNVMRVDPKVAEMIAACMNLSLALIHTASEFPDE